MAITLYQQQISLMNLALPGTQCIMPDVAEIDSGVQAIFLGLWYELPGGGLWPIGELGPRLTFVAKSKTFYFTSKKTFNLVAE